MLRNPEILAGKYIREGDISYRYFRVLIAAGAGTKIKDLIGEETVIPADKLAELQPRRLLSLRNFGEKGLEEIRAHLQKLAEEAEAKQE